MTAPRPGIHRSHFFYSAGIGVTPPEYREGARPKKRRKKHIMLKTDHVPLVPSNYPQRGSVMRAVV